MDTRIDGKDSVKAQRAAIMSMLNAFNRMEVGSRARIKSHMYDVDRLRELLERPTADFPGRRTKLLRKLGEAERKMIKENAWLDEILKKKAEEGARLLALPEFDDE